MLGALALKWRWRERHARRRQADRPAEPRDRRQRPGLLGEVLPLLGRRAAARARWRATGYHLDAERGRRRTATRTRSASPPSSARPSTAATSRSSEIAAALDKLERDTGLDIPIHVDAASGGFVAPFIQPELEWDFRIPRVQSINASGHKYGLVYPGVGWAIWRDADALPQDLIFDVNYLGGHMPTFALNFSRPGSEVIAQYFMFASLGFEGYRAGPAALLRRRPVPRRRDRQDRALRAGQRRQRAARVRVQAEAGRDELHGLRRLRAAARARLAGARVHVPRKSRGPRGAADRRARRA